MGLGLTSKKPKSTTSSSSTTQKTTAPQTTTPAATPSTTAPQSGVTYNANTDYQKAINDAVARGDYVAAGQYEQQRNAKINDMNAAGTNANGYSTTSNYAGWLDTTDYGTIAKQQMAQGASAADVQKTYNDRYNKANGTIGLQQYADDELMQQMLDYINSAENTELPEFDEEYWSENQPTFNDNYEGISEELFNKILSREDFSYDPNDDPLYGYYQDMYRREGDRERENTLADIASSAGGMNSWAVTAAQQAQNNYNAQMTDKIPELYQLAYQMYLNEKASEVENLGLANQMSDRQYNRYMDQMGIWRDDRDFSYGMYRDNMGDYQWGTNFNYQVGRDQIADNRYDKEWEYNVGRDQVSDAWREKEWEYNVGRDQIADNRYDQEWNYNVGRDQIADNRYNQEWDYNVGRDQIADNRYNQEWNYGVGTDEYNRAQSEREDAYNRAIDMISAGVTPDAETLKKAGLSSATAAAMAKAQAQAGGTTKKSSSSSKSSSSKSSGDMDFDGLFEAAYNSQYPETFLKQSANYKKYGFSSSSGLVDAYEEWAGEKETEKDIRFLESSTINLGIGPVDADYIENTLKPAGAVVVTADGYAWANGWNANNYKQKLNGAGATKNGFLDPNFWAK